MTRRRKRKEYPFFKLVNVALMRQMLFLWTKPITANAFGFTWGCLNDLRYIPHIYSTFVGYKDTILPHPILHGAHFFFLISKRVGYNIYIYIYIYI